MSDETKARDDEGPDKDPSEAWSDATHVAPVPGSYPERIAGYRIKRVIASGGMGTVYLAVQEDPRRTVALKVMKPGISSLAVMRRFKYEAQILARLRHPNIAQVFEAGKHHSGDSVVPYFAMEYIPNAKTLIEYARECRLTTSLRLELFTKVCDAVHHGHTKGIIHRDLKPENILVESNGEPKIIDFGVARATDADMVVTMLQTEVGQLLGTVAYMSPEQCRTDPHDLDARSDVYSLGVVLFELLCEQLPYNVRHLALHDAARVICEEPAVRPGELNRTLVGDVETIMLKVLEKDRAHRYQSATALAEDIRRYLRHEPIEARPPSMMYQLRMMAQRHHAAFFAIKAIIAVILVASIVAVAFAIDAGAKERRLEELDRENTRLQERIHELQGENAELKARRHGGT